MFKERITYVDYDGQTRTEDFRFNLTKSELMEMEFDTEGGLEKAISRMVDGLDTRRIGKLFKDLILKSYGEKSLDGKRFVKSEEISKAFSETEAYNQLYMKLLTDEKFANAFINGLVDGVQPLPNNSAVPAPPINMPR